jgi:hypothetical protein
LSLRIGTDRLRQGQCEDLWVSKYKTQLSQKIHFDDGVERLDQLVIQNNESKIMIRKSKK